MTPSFRQLLFVLISAALLAAAANAAWGADRPDQVVAKLSLTDLTPSLTRSIAEFAAPAKITARAGESLRALVQRHCERDDAMFLGLLKERSTILGLKPEQVTAAYIFPKEETLELPYCLKLPEQAAAAKTAELIKPRMLGGQSDVFIDPASAPSFNGPDPRRGKRRAVGGQKRMAVSADRPEYVALPLRSGSEARVALASLNTEVPTFRSEQKGIRHVTVLSSTEDKCAPLSADRLPENHPVDTYAILRVLGLNASVNPRRGAVPMPIRIGDSGLYYEPLAPTFMSESVQLQTGMVPYEAYRRSQHGTYVASSALGGPYFMRFWSRLDQPVIIQPRNIISKNCRPVTASAGSATGLQDFCEVDDKGLMQVLSSGSRGGIVNLSIAHPGELAAVTNELGSAGDRFLIVVSAGNDGNEIDRQSYPASLVRLERFAKYMLVVGALEGDGRRLSPNSSYHPEFVELAAPGCKVPVYEHSGNAYKIVPQSGTSIAAGIVSFAAALVSQQMDMPPALVKRRLLISADYEPGLEERAGGPRGRKVRNNARLNIPRALALFHDVVDLKDGRRIYGKLKDGENFVLALCGGQRAKRRSELRSLSIYTGDTGKTVFFQYGDPDEQDKPDSRLVSESCPLSQPNPDNPGVDLAAFELTMEDAEAGRAATPFTLGDVVNITLAHDPYWEN